jgi:hypothetical protein
MAMNGGEGFAAQKVGSSCEQGCFMASYRFYWRGQDNRIAGAENHDCTDDLGALEQARSMARERAIEVWQATRYVALVKAGDEALTASDPSLL